MNDLNFIVNPLHNNMKLFVILKIIRSNKIIPLKSQHLKTVLYYAYTSKLYNIQCIYFEKNKFIVSTKKH